MMLPSFRNATFAVLLLCGCYQPRALDSRSVLQELRAEENATTPGRAAAPRAAAGEPPSGGAVTADQAVELALRWNPDLREMRHQTDVAEGEITTARTLKNPTVEVDLLHMQRLPEQRAWAIELDWEPPQPGRYHAGTARARAMLEASRGDVAEAALQLEMSVRAAHAAVVTLQEERAIIEQAAETRRKIVELVERRVANGVSTRLDLSLAQLAASQTERERDDMLAKEIAARKTLAELVGAQAPLRAQGELPAQSPYPSDVQQLEDAAMRARPAVKAASARYAQREQAVRLEHAKRWPDLKLAGRYRQNETTANPNDFMFGVQLSLPFLDQNRGPIRVAEATRDMARERFRKVVGNVRRELAAALEELQVRDQSLKRFRESVLPSLEGHEKSLAAAAAGGQLDIVAVLTAQDVILRARREHCELRLAYHRARLALERAAGRHGAQEQTDGDLP